MQDEPHSHDASCPRTSQEQALAKAAEYGAPRWPSIREYAQIVGFNCEEALTILNGAPKKY